MTAEISVPATVANLGPGFDCLGAAVGLYLKVSFQEAVRTELAGKGRIRSLDNSYIYQAFLAAFGAAGQPVPPVRIEIIQDYPSARGLGASASAIVAGLAGARALGELHLKDEELARLAVDIEGHADNVLPALLGGLVLSLDGGWIRLQPTGDIAPLILVARDSFKTEKARKAVPGEVQRADAVANASATAALVAILTGQAPADRLVEAMQDRLHQPFRLPLMPSSLEFFEKLEARRIPVALSGAGPSLVALVELDRLEEAATTAHQLAPEGWSVMTPGWDLAGAG